MKLKRIIAAVLCGLLTAGMAASVSAADAKRYIGQYNYNHSTRLEIPTDIPLYDIGNLYNKGSDKNDFWSLNPPWVASITAYLTYDEKEQAIKMDHKVPSTSGNGLDVYEKNMRIRFKAKAFNIESKFLNPGVFSTSRQDLGFFFAVKLRTVDITSGPWDGMPGWSIDYHPFIHEDGDSYKKWHNAYATAVNVMDKGFPGGQLPWFTDDTSKKINWFDGKYHDVDIAIWDDKDGYANIVMELDDRRIINFKDNMKNRYSDPGAFSIMPIACSLYIKPADPLKGDPSATTPTSKKDNNNSTTTSRHGTGNDSTASQDQTAETTTGNGTDTTDLTQDSSTIDSDNTDAPSDRTTASDGDTVNNDKPKGTSGALPIILGIIAAVILIGGGSCAYLFYFRPRLKK